MCSHNQHCIHPTNVVNPHLKRQSNGRRQQKAIKRVTGNGKEWFGAFEGQWSKSGSLICDSRDQKKNTVEISEN